MNSVMGIMRRWGMVLFVGVCVGMLSGQGNVDQDQLKEEEEARKSPVKVTVKAQNFRVRSYSPIPVEIEIKWYGQGLLEGSLDLNTYGNQGLLHRYVTDDKAVAAKSSLRFNAMLPPVAGNFDGQVSVRGYFRAKDKTYPIEASVIQVPNDNQRTHAVLVGAGLSGASRADNYLKYADALRLEGWNPSDRMYVKGLVTQFSYLETEVMPQHVYGYFGFDLVVLANKGWGSQKAKTLEAIGKWVESGGRLLISPEGNVGSVQVDFLNRMLKLGGSDVVASQGREDELVMTGLKAGERLLKLRAGLGRVVVLVKGAGEADYFKMSEWLGAKMFLWGVRKAQEGEILKHGKWKAYETSDNQGGKSPVMFNHYSLGAESALSKQLQPENIRLMPFGLIVLLLGVFVLLIGPGDYFFLGMLRMRKFTWLVFPAMSILFTFMMVKSAEYYTGTEDHLRSYHVVDYGTDHRAHRVSRYEYRFPGSPKDVLIAGKNEIVSVVDRSGITESRGYRIDELYTTVTAEKGLTYRGTYPTKYTIDHSLRQWKPQIYRYTSVDVGALPMEPKWGEVGFGELQKIRDMNRKLAEQLCGKGFRGKIQVVKNGQVYIWQGMYQRGERNSLRNYLRDVNQFRYGNPRYEEVGVKFSSRPMVGVKSILITKSPTGAIEGEDMVIYDDGDRGEILVMVEQTVGNDVYLYRKVYREGED